MSFEEIHRGVCMGWVWGIFQPNPTQLPRVEKSPTQPMAALKTRAKRREE